MTSATKDTTDVALQIANKTSFKNQRYYCPVTGCGTSYSFRQDVSRHIRVEHTKTAKVSKYLVLAFVCLQLILLRFLDKVIENNSTLTTPGWRYFVRPIFNYRIIIVRFARINQSIGPTYRDIYSNATVTSMQPMPIQSGQLKVVI